MAVTVIPSRLNTVDGSNYLGAVQDFVGTEPVNGSLRLGIDFVDSNTVIGRQASDAALLKANDTIRKMFAYRHDILKALMADGVKLVVLGRNEKISDLPEYQRWDSGKTDHTARFLDYAPETRLLVVGGSSLSIAARSCRISSRSEVLSSLSVEISRVICEASCSIPEYSGTPLKVSSCSRIRLARASAIVMRVRRSAAVPK